MNKKREESKEKKLNLYKVPGYDFLYLDENGEPYSVNKRALEIREQPNGYKEYYLVTHEHGHQRKEVHKNIVAKTFLNNDDKFVYHKDGNIENYHPDNLALSSKRNEDYYFTCPICNKRYRKQNSSVTKNRICSKCKDKLERKHKKLIKSERRKELYDYFINNERYLRMTDVRRNILRELKKGKFDREIADTLNISRQAVNDNIKRMEIRIEQQKRKELLYNEICK